MPSRVEARVRLTTQATRSTHAQHGFPRPQAGLLPAHAQRVIFDAEGVKRKGAGWLLGKRGPPFTHEPQQQAQHGISSYSFEPCAEMKIGKG